MGKFNMETGGYDEIYFDNIVFAIDTIDGLLDKWGDHSAVSAIEPVNEPWWSSDLDILKGFYRDVRDLMREKAPRLTFVFHDSFHFDANVWNDLFADDDMDNVVMDTHQYLAWWGTTEYIGSYCDGYGNTVRNAKNIKYPVWVGEWSLATDVCALWLGGFNDNNTPYANECQWVDCLYTYLDDSTGTDFDRTADMLGPYGSNTLSTVQKGKCPKDSANFDEDAVQTLGTCMMYIFNDAVDGHFMWTARNELEERWNYVSAYDKGWIKNSDATNPDAGAFQFTQ
jgi:hypothetical protein